MKISSNRKLQSNFAALIAVAVVIGNGLCIQGSFATDANLNEMDNEVDVPLDVAAGANSSSKQEPVETDILLRNLNVSEHSGDLCNRVCVRGQKRVCYFEFTLEYYQAMGVACGKCAQGVEEDCNNPQCIVGDGVEKGVMSINRQVPGPAIQVCKGDLVIVDVHNKAAGTAATLHWHGLHMVDTPHMDGVPFVTQCPIPFANSFRYQFYATEAGTQFYHSHSGHHKVNGQYGALIVRQPEEASSDLYDYDLTEQYILISDWMHVLGEQLFPGLPSSGGIFPDSVLINGRGVYTNSKTGERTAVRPTVYYVTSGKRYRFRLINSISHACPFQLQIEKHNLTIIASDSFEVQPLPFDTLVSNSGERYDFILNATHTSGDFWIRVRGLGVCTTNLVESYALIRYKASETVGNGDELPLPPFPKYDEQYPIGVVLNHPNATCWGNTNRQCVSELKALEEDEQLRFAIPDHKLFLSFQNHLVPNEEIFVPGHYNHFSNINSNVTIVGAVNDISLVLPDYPPLTQPFSIDESTFCDSSNKPEKCAGYKLCPCVHRLKVKRNSIVELIIIDETKNIGRLHHPFHLHGTRFMVTGMGQHPYGVPMTLALAKEMERKRMLPRDFNNSRPPFKDTVSIPSTGYAVVRFRAINPGFWLLHCHYEWHLAIGMGLIMQVGETWEMRQAPYNFPKCGNYLPPIQSH